MKIKRDSQESDTNFLSLLKSKISKQNKQFQLKMHEELSKTFSAKRREIEKLQMKRKHEFDEFVAKKNELFETALKEFEDKRSIFEKEYKNMRRNCSEVKKMFKNVEKITFLIKKEMKNFKEKGGRNCKEEISRVAGELKNSKRKMEKKIEGFNGPKDRIGSNLNDLFK